MPHELLTGLAGSTGGPAACRALAEAQLSKHLLLIAELLRRWPGPDHERDGIVAALEAVRSTAPHVAARVLGAPLVGAWATIANRAAAEGCAEPADFAHLGAVTAVACAAAGVDADLRAPVRDGVVAFPGLGLLTIGETGIPGETGVLGGTGTARVVVAGGTITVDAGHGPVSVPAHGSAAGWQPVRHLTAGGGATRVELMLDDADPYRHGYHAPPAPRLSDAEFARWQELFTQAWQLLVTHIPGRAAEVAAGLRALVPLQHDGRSALSATIRHIYGVFGLTRPATAADFAVTLVHEFQHAKLSALLDLTQLSDPDDQGRYFAPWRTDPRPVAGLLQGVYAFAGVADTWRALRDADDLGGVAEQEFADARLQVDRSLTALESSGALTFAGERFTGHLRRFADTMLAVPVPDDIAQQAERRHLELHRRWLAVNGAA